MAPLQPNITAALTDRIDRACADVDPRKALPGVVAVVVNADGEEIFAHASGYRGLESPDLMTLDTVFWIASCTKLVTSIACMQLVEQGRITLDDAEHVEQLCPELGELCVLRDGELVERKRGITLRMLLTHTGSSLHYRCMGGWVGGNDG